MEIRKEFNMKLLEPGRIGTLEIKNRIIMAPMGIRGVCDAGSVNTGVNACGHTMAPGLPAVPE